MKKTLVYIAAMMLLGFSGCASKDMAKPDASKIAEPKGQKVNAYYYAPFVDSATAQEKLKAAGFDVVATYHPTKKSESIIITCPGLKKAAAKPTRGFAAVMRVLVDEENNRIAYTNPIYFEKAFLQDDYNHAIAAKVLSKLQTAFGEATPSTDAYDYDDLAGYHFMMGMPYYEDPYELGEGKNAELLAKLDAYKKGKMVVFKLDLGNGRTLVGVDLDKRTKKFVKKIGTQNAEILPYTILIEDGKAIALAAKYYIAISYPMLSMGEFMTIATVPGAIEKDLEKPFK